MLLHSAIRKLVTRTPAGTLAGRFRPLRTLYRDQLWARPGRLSDFYGKFSSYREAADAIPSRLRANWESDAIKAGEFLFPSTFATIFWISKLIQPGASLVDLGGATGNVYYQYVKRASFPDDARWHIVDFPRATIPGRKIAESRGAKHLTFGSDLKEIEQVDFLLSVGCMQYMEQPTEEIISSLRSPPRHILINMIPFTSGPEFWTIESLAPGASPYHIYNETSFVDVFQRLGYDIADRWPVPELHCEVPFHPECHVPEFAGLLLTRR